MVNWVWDQNYDPPGRPYNIHHEMIDDVIYPVGQQRRRGGGGGGGGGINSSAGEANYCRTHVVRNKRSPVAGKRSLQTTYANMTRKQLFKCVVTTKVLTV